MKRIILHIKKRSLTSTLIMLLIACICGIIACSPSSDKSNKNQPNNNEEASNNGTAASDYDPLRGEGKYDKMELSEVLDPELSKRGKVIADLKCASCHRYTSEKLVGPGWAGVSKKHKPEWLMNFILNPDPMIDKDPELQLQLADCLLRMPNQNLSDDDAREVVEFMRENDGLK